MPADKLFISLYLDEDVSKKIGAILKNRGFDHYVYTKPGIARPVVIPEWPEVPVFIIKNNLRTANISRDGDSDKNSSFSRKRVTSATRRGENPVISRGSGSPGQAGG